MKCAECHARLYLRGRRWYSYDVRDAPPYTQKCTRALGNHVAVEEDE